MTTKRICLWSGPRNISTALMYSFAQRPDTIVTDEPLYAHYLSVTGVEHPGKEEILQAQERDGEKVVKEIILGCYHKPVAFFKLMTHHLVQINQNFLSLVSNMFLIRDPKQIISSYSKVRPKVTMQDIGIEKQWHLFKELGEKNLKPVVVDSNEILKDPVKILSGLCDVLDIPFYSSMLRWPAGPKSEDGVWAKYWYRNVHMSTNFAKQETSNISLPDYLLPLYRESKKYYDQLYIHSLKA